MKTVSKPLVAFLLSAQIYIYQVVCLVGSGIEEASRILGLGGLVTVAYLLFAVRCFFGWRRVFIVSVIISLLFGAWAIGSFGLRSGGGNGLFFRDYFSGDVFYCLDVLYHSTIVESIKHYNVPSILLGSVAPIQYHLGAHWTMALIGKITGLSGMAMVGYIYPLIFIPLFAVVLLYAIQALKIQIRGVSEFTIVDAAVLLIFICGYFPKYLDYRYGPLFTIFCQSESCLLGSIFLLTSVALLPTINRAFAEQNWSFKKNGILFLLIPALIIGAAYSKISSGFMLMAMLAGILLLHLRKKDGGLVWSSFLLGFVYVFVFSWVYLITASGSPSTSLSESCWNNIYLFAYRAAHAPFSFVLAFLPVAAFFFKSERGCGNVVRFSLGLAVLLSCVPFVLLRVHGASEVYFWVNSYLISVVYFLAIGMPGKLLEKLDVKWGASAKCAFVVGVVAFALSPVLHKIVRAGCCEPWRHGDHRFLGSTRYQNLVKAKRFVEGHGRTNVLVYVTKDYWTARSSDRRKAKSMPKAYIFAVQAYLGVPVIGVMRSDSQNVYARVTGAWEALDSPVSYDLDAFCAYEVPEYTLEMALEFAKKENKKILLRCGAHDSIDIYDTTASGGFIQK